MTGDPATGALEVTVGINLALHGHMSKSVHEIMNREVLMLRAGEATDSALGFLRALGVSGAPVVDEDRKPIGVVSWRDLLDVPVGPLAERMTSPAVTVRGDDTIAHAADVLAEKGVHRLIVVDSPGRVVGAISSLDVLRGLTGHAIHHPSPHRDQKTGIVWTDDEPFELAASEAAPDRAGVLVLIESVPGERDEIVLVESPGNVRQRLLELMSVSPSEHPELGRWLEHPSRLRFRAAAVADGRARSAVARTLESRASRELRSELLR
jgi:CBS domain-containing protein